MAKPIDFRPSYAVQQLNGPRLDHRAKLQELEHLLGGSNEVFSEALALIEASSNLEDLAVLSRFLFAVQAEVACGKETLPVSQSIQNGRHLPDPLSALCLAAAQRQNELERKTRQPAPQVLAP
jgi:hypothetical protein